MDLSDLNCLTCSPRDGDRLAKWIGRRQQSKVQGQVYAAHDDCEQSYGRQLEERSPGSDQGHEVEQGHRGEWSTGRSVKGDERHNVQHKDAIREQKHLTWPKQDMELMKEYMLRQATKSRTMPTSPGSRRQMSSIGGLQHPISPKSPKPGMKMSQFLDDNSQGEVVSSSAARSFSVRVYSRDSLSSNGELNESSSVESVPYLPAFSKASMMSSTPYGGAKKFERASKTRITLPMRKKRKAVLKESESMKINQKGNENEKEKMIVVDSSQQSGKSDVPQAIHGRISVESSLDQNSKFERGSEKRSTLPLLRKKTVLEESESMMISNPGSGCGYDNLSSTGSPDVRSKRKESLKVTRLKPKAQDSLDHTEQYEAFTFGLKSDPSSTLISSKSLSKKEQNPKIISSGPVLGSEGVPNITKVGGDEDIFPTGREAFSLGIRSSSRSPHHSTPKSTARKFDTGFVECPDFTEKQRTALEIQPDKTGIGLSKISDPRLSRHITPKISTQKSKKTLSEIFDSAVRQRRQRKSQPVSTPSYDPGSDPNNNVPGGNMSPRLSQVKKDLFQGAILERALCVRQEELRNIEVHCTFL